MCFCVADTSGARIPVVAVCVDSTSALGKLALACAAAASFYVWVWARKLVGMIGAASGSARKFIRALSGFGITSILSANIAVVTIFRRSYAGAFFTPIGLRPRAKIAIVASFAVILWRRNALMAGIAGIGRTRISVVAIFITLAAAVNGFRAAHHFHAKIICADISVNAASHRASRRVRFANLITYAGTGRLTGVWVSPQNALDVTTSSVVAIFIGCAAVLDWLMNTPLFRIAGIRCARVAVIASRSLFDANKGAFHDLTA